MGGLYNESKSSIKIFVVFLYADGSPVADPGVFIVQDGLKRGGGQRGHCCDLHSVMFSGRASSGQENEKAEICMGTSSGPWVFSAVDRSLLSGGTGVFHEFCQGSYDYVHMRGRGHPWGHDFLRTEREKEKTLGKRNILCYNDEKIFCIR